MNLISFCGVNVLKNAHVSKGERIFGANSLLNLSTNPLKPLEKDTILFKGVAPKAYKLEREPYSGKYTQKFPLEKDNSYKVVYHIDVSSECDENGIAPYPPSSLKFEKPVDLAQGIDISKRHMCGYKEWCIYDEKQFDTLKELVLNSPELKSEKLVSCMDAAFNTIVLELEGNRVLKMVKYNPFPEGRKFEPSFDLPLLSKVYKCGDYYAFVQEKAEVHYMEDDTALNSVIDRIKEAGYEPFDIEGNDTQIGWSEIKQDYMLLDTECAKVKK